MIYYVLIGIVAGALTNITRPKKYDNVSTGLKAAVPVLSGVFWPLVALFFLYHFIKELVS